MYDNDPEDLETLGWDRFVAGVWESIFTGYRSNRGIRTIGRRWSDLLQGGIGCSEQVADEVIRLPVVLRQDRDLLSIRDPERLTRAMEEVLADTGQELAELDLIRPAERAELLAAFGKLFDFLCGENHDQDDDQYYEPDEEPAGA